MNSGSGQEVILELREVHVYYGAIHALKGINLSLRKGEIVCLIGANGAGKSTTLNTISGIARARQGKINFKGEAIQRCPAHRIVEKGISQSPEGREISAHL